MENLQQTITTKVTVCVCAKIRKNIHQHTYISKVYHPSPPRAVDGNGSTVLKTISGYPIGRCFLRGEHYTGTEMGELRTQYPIKGGSVAFGETDCSARWQVLRRVTNEPAPERIFA